MCNITNAELWPHKMRILNKYNNYERAKGPPNGPFPYCTGLETKGEMEKSNCLLSSFGNCIGTLNFL